MAKKKVVVPEREELVALAKEINAVLEPTDPIKVSRKVTDEELIEAIKACEGDIYESDFGECDDEDKVQFTDEALKTLTALGVEIVSEPATEEAEEEPEEEVKPKAKAKKGAKVVEEEEEEVKPKAKKGKKVVEPEPEEEEEEVKPKAKANKGKKEVQEELPLEKPVKGAKGKKVVEPEDDEDDDAEEAPKAKKGAKAAPAKAEKAEKAKPAKKSKEKSYGRLDSILDSIAANRCATFEEHKAWSGKKYCKERDVAYNEDYSNEWLRVALTALAAEGACKLNKKNQYDFNA